MHSYFVLMNEVEKRCTKCTKEQANCTLHWIPATCARYSGFTECSYKAGVFNNMYANDISNVR